MRKNEVKAGKRLLRCDGTSNAHGHSTSVQLVRVVAWVITMVIIVGSAYGGVQHGYISVVVATSPERLQVPSRYFAETGHNVGGHFLAFYTAQQGELVFGKPITEMYLEQDKRSSILSMCVWSATLATQTAWL